MNLFGRAAQAAVAALLFVRPRRRTRRPEPPGAHAIAAHRIAATPLARARTVPRSLRTAARDDYGTAPRSRRARHLSVLQPPPVTRPRARAPRPAPLARIYRSARLTSALPSAAPPKRRYLCCDAGSVSAPLPDPRLGGGSVWRRLNLRPRPLGAGRARSVPGACAPCLTSAGPAAAPGAARRGWCAPGRWPVFVTSQVCARCPDLRTAVSCEPAGPCCQPCSGPSMPILDGRGEGAAANACCARAPRRYPNNLVIWSTP